MHTDKKTPRPKAMQEKINFRLSKKQLNRLTGLAKIWTNGDRSEYIRMMLFERGQKFK